MPVDEISLGDYVLAGGEVAVLVIVEAVARLLPGVLGNADSVVDDSFAAGTHGLLEAPVYTKPARVAWPRRARRCCCPAISGAIAAVARRAVPASAPRRASRTCCEVRDPSARCRIPGRLWHHEEVVLATGGGPPGRLAGRAHPSTRRPRRARAACFRIRTKVTRDEHPRHSGRRLPARATSPTSVPVTRSRCTSGSSRAPAPASRSSRASSSVGRGAALRETFTVRKVSFGVGVERTFPVHTPIIDKIEVVTRGDVRRAKLYYLRDLRGKTAKIKEKRETVAR